MRMGNVVISASKVNYLVSRFYHFHSEMLKSNHYESFDQTNDFKKPFLKIKLFLFHLLSFTCFIIYYKDFTQFQVCFVLLYGSNISAWPLFVPMFDKE